MTSNIGAEKFALGVVEPIGPWIKEWGDLMSKKHNYWRMLRCEITVVGLLPAEVGQKTMLWIDDVSTTTLKTTADASAVVASWSQGSRRSPMSGTSRLTFVSPSPKWYPFRAVAPGASDYHFYSSYELGYGSIIGQASTGGSGAVVVQMSVTFEYKDPKGYEDKIELWHDRITSALPASEDCRTGGSDDSLNDTLAAVSIGSLRQPPARRDPLVLTSTLHFDLNVSSNYQRVQTITLPEGAVEVFAPCEDVHSVPSTHIPGYGAVPQMRVTDPAGIRFVYLLEFCEPVNLTGMFLSAEDNFYRLDEGNEFWRPTWNHGWMRREVRLSTFEGPNPVEFGRFVFARASQFQRLETEVGGARRLVVEIIMSVHDSDGHNEASLAEMRSFWTAPDQSHGMTFRGFGIQFYGLPPRGPR